MYIAPWTSPKSYIVAKTLTDRYLRSVDMKNVDVGSLNTYFFLDFDTPTTGARRLLQTEKSGARLKVTVKTNFIRVESEIAAVVQGALSGTLAADLTTMGINVDNATIWEEPQVLPIKNLPTSGEDTSSSSSSLPVWGIAAIIAAVLIILPVPVYCVIKHRKRKHREALERQAEESAAARARMQSRIIKPGGKSMTMRPGDTHNIMVRAGSISAQGGMYPGPNYTSHATPGRENSFSQLPLSARGAALGVIAPNGQRVPSLTGQGPFMTPPGASFNQYSSRSGYHSTGRMTSGRAFSDEYTPTNTDRSEYTE